MASLWILVASLALVGSCLFFFAPRVALALGRFTGWSLKKRTSSRRELLTTRAQAERKQLEEQGKGQRSLDDEWEKVSRTRTPERVERKLKDQVSIDWDGVVGFFHPFWYAQTKPICEQECRRLTVL